MESTSRPNLGLADEGTRRARKIRTRMQAKRAAAEEQDRAAKTGSYTKDEYWKLFVKTEADIVTFYSLYYPEYPEILAKSIAKRISGIIEKSRSGKELDEIERGYYIRSQQPDVEWDPMVEIKQHELQAKVNLTMRRLDQLDAFK